ncbi:MAG TPA: hypothetical protein VL485_24165 [Ktedonobacteraceae bacterium]|nr:hypothetical protein [Ktedonobacteraceae bacterium]
MTYVICNGRVPLTGLHTLIAHCRFPAEALVLLECLPQHTITRQKERQDLLWFGSFEQKIAFENYTSGRIFQASGELRWEKERDDFQVVYVGDEGEFSRQIEAILRDYSNNTSLPELPSLRSQRKEYYLFGTRLQPGDLEKIGPLAQPGDFAEVRIHRLLRYPLKGNSDGPIRFIVDELFDEKTGQRVLFRFVGLNENENKEATPA